MASHLDFEGVYDKNKRYIVHNWSPEDFTQRFGAEHVYNANNVIETQPAYEITIKAGEMRELGQFEAYTITKHLVDREMVRGSELLVQRERERIEAAVGNKDARKPFEDKTISEVKAGEESPFMAELRKKIIAEEQAKIVGNSQPEVKEEENKEEVIIPEKRFCEFCDSKGVKHKKDCPTLKKDESAEFAGL